MKRGLDRITIAAGRLSKQLGLFSGLICLVLALIMASDVVGRYFLSSPIHWAWELNNYLLLASVFFGGAYTQLVQGHVSIDIVYRRLPRRVQKRVFFLLSVLALSYLCWLDWLVAKQALASFLTHEKSCLEFWPLFPVKFLMPVGVSLLILQLLVQLVGRLVGRSDRE